MKPDVTKDQHTEWSVSCKSGRFVMQSREGARGWKRMHAHEDCGPHVIEKRVVISTAGPWKAVRA